MFYAAHKAMPRHKAQRLGHPRFPTLLMLRSIAQQCVSKRVAPHPSTRALTGAPQDKDARLRSRDASASESSSGNVTPSTKKWSAGRRQGRGPRHANERYHPLALRAWRAPQTIPSREPPASGALRLPALHHGSLPRLSTAAAREPHLPHLQDRLRNGVLR
jgi:hypothetical protein